MELIISDACRGLVESIAEYLPDARWQRCVVHFYRNVFSHVPATKLREVSHMLKAIHAQETRATAEAKTDRIDGEALVRTLMAWRRGEPRVCAMVRVPTLEEEDRRRVCRELKSLTGERIRHVNRRKGVLFAQAIGDYEPRNKDRRNRLEVPRTGDGRPLPRHLKAVVLRELEIIELLNRQIDAVKSERDALLA